LLTIDGHLALYEKADPATDAIGQLEMAEFHESVSGLAGDEREVFESVLYQGMTQAEVAKLLEVSKGR
jgi:DNA-directed RNA polymerase specialized sigma24 family protein